MNVPERPSDFEPHVGTMFTTTTGGMLELASVTRLARQGSPREEPFNLVFVSVDGTVLAQQLVELRHESLGELVVFTVPIGPDDRGRMQLEAVFN